MLGSRSNSAENSKELCRNKCQKDIEKLEILFKGQNGSSTSQRKPNRYCKGNCLAISADIEPSTKSEKSLHEVDLSQKLSERLSAGIQEPLPKFDSTVISEKLSEKSLTTVQKPNEEVDSAVISQKLSEEDEKCICGIDSMDSKKSSERSVKPLAEINTMSDLNRKRSETIGKHLKEVNSAKQVSIREVKSLDETEKENEGHVRMEPCYEEKLCPTIDLILNRRIRAAIRTKNIEIDDLGFLESDFSNNFQQKPKNRSEIYNERKLSKYNCEEGKLCGTLKSILGHGTGSLPTKPGTEILSSIESLPRTGNLDSKVDLSKKPNEHPENKNQEENKPDKNKLNSQSEESCCEISPIISDGTSQKSVKLTTEEDLSERRIEPLPSNIISTSPMEPPTEIKLIDDAKKLNEMRVNENENAFEKWKRNCEKGIYALESLLNVCEKDPDSLLSPLEVSLRTDKKLHKDFFENPDIPEEFYELKKTLGKEFGDPKYHLLMVDASTSISKLDTKPKYIEKVENTPPHKASVLFEHSEGSEIFENLIKDEAYLIFAQQEPDEKLPKSSPIRFVLGEKRVFEESEFEESESEEQHSDENEVKPEEVPIPKIFELLQQQSKDSSKGVSTVASPVPQKNVPEKFKQPTPSVINEAILNTVFKDNGQSNIKEEDKLISEEDKLISEEDKLISAEKRVSTVSWLPNSSAQGTMSPIRSTTSSLEEVIKKATAKAENFRHNLDKKRQNSLLDIVKKRHSFDTPLKEEECKPKDCPPKKKRFSNFFIKKKAKKDMVDNLSDSDEDSTKELEKMHASPSSSARLNNYRRKSSIIENPVFQKNKDLNEYLDNIN